jgi:ABC-type phosphate transport system auxiliary subunit
MIEGIIGLAMIVGVGLYINNQLKFQKELVREISELQKELTMVEKTLENMEKQYKKLKNVKTLIKG